MKITETHAPVPATGHGQHNGLMMDREDEEKSCRQKRILIIEDDVSACQAIATLLKSHSYLVTATYDAESGLKAAQSDVPDLVIVDLGLPGISGLALARKLLESLRTWHLPLFIMTGDVSPNIAKFAEELGVKKVFHKPLDMPTLLNSISSILNPDPEELY